MVAQRSARRTLRSCLRATLVALGLGLGFSAASGVAQATVVERVVAVVGEHAIFLTDLKKRARPRLGEIYAQVPPGAQRSVFESQMYRALLTQMVDERLEETAAERARLSATSEEVDRALTVVAGQNRMTVEQLLAAKLATGETIAEYREELRRQIISEKLIGLRVSPRVRISSEDVKIGYAQLQREERQQLAYRMQWIVLFVPENASEEAKAERRKLADKIAADARAGADFTALAKQLSDDSATRDSGGDLGKARPGEFTPAVEEVAIRLDVGEISNPFLFRGNLAVLRVMERDPSKLPPLAKAESEVAAKVYGDRLLKARRQWLDELKRNIHVDVRQLAASGRRRVHGGRCARRDGRGLPPCPTNVASLDC
jgi:peptidyl-prolyl cis-trans isomerase SurA